MEFPVVNGHGTLMYVLSGTRYESLLQSVPPGHSALMADVPRSPSWWSGSEWVPIPPRPAEYMVWDEVDRSWVDPRTPSQRDADAWDQIKRIRDSIATAQLTVHVDGRPMTFDSDSQSQAAILSAALRALMAATSGVPWSITWTLADNTEVDLTAAQMLQVFQAMMERAASARLAASAARPSSTRS